MLHNEIELMSLPAWLPDWAAGLAVTVGAFATALLLHGWIVSLLNRRMKRRSDFTRSLVVRTKAPGRFALLIAALSVSVHVAPIPTKTEAILQHGLLIAFIILVGWAVMTAIDIGSAISLRRYRTDVADNTQARKMLTQTRILRRSVNVAVLVVTLAIALMTIPGVKQIGVSLLAAGGAASLIVGLALQPVLSNILAGIQIAFTQPIRIGDAITINGEFGQVEEIKSTYVVIRLRDLRRMIVPLKIFLEQPFQNWTRDSSNLDADVMLNVDQRVPVSRLRQKVEEIVHASPLWDQRLLRIQVNEIREKNMEVRCQVSARNAADSVDLRAEIREQVLGWLQAELPHFLPRNGVDAEVDLHPRPDPNA